MQFATCSQNTKMCSSPVEKKETLHYLLTEPLLEVRGLDKDAPRIKGESCEDYIRRRGLPPINGKLFDRNSKQSVSDQHYELICIACVKSKEKQFKCLADRWASYDEMIARQNAIPFTNKRDKDGYTPLHRAVYNRDLDLVKELLQVPGIDVNMYTSNTHHGSIASKHMTEETALGIAKAAVRITKDNIYTEIEAELLNAPGIDANKLYYID